jgi:hypothetical protein
VASCEFCSVNGFQVPRPAGASAAEPRPRPRWRGRGMDDVCREVLWIAREYRIRSFVFNDASFEDPGAYGRTRVAEFCDTIARSGLSFAFRCSMRAETVARHGRELLPMMRRCGFTNVFIGIESGSDADLHAFAKLASSSENDAALDAARECDVDVTMGYIMFHPGSTMEDLQRSCRSLIRWGGDKVGYFTRAVDVYFGTPLHRRLSREGLLTAEFSYANPLGYRFACEEVGAISRGLDVVRQHPVVGTLDGRLYHLGYTMSALRALFPDAAGTFVERFSQIRQDVAAMAAEFFEPMFGGNTRSIGDARVQAFLRACERMNADLARLGSRILFAKAFASFFAGEVDRLLRRVGTTSAVC